MLMFLTQAGLSTALELPSANAIVTEHDAAPSKPRVDTQER